MLQTAVMDHLRKQFPRVHFSRKTGLPPLGKDDFDVEWKDADALTSEAIHMVMAGFVSGWQAGRQSVSTL